MLGVVLVVAVVLAVLLALTVGVGSLRVLVSSTEFVDIAVVGVEFCNPEYAYSRDDASALSSSASSFLSLSLSESSSSNSSCSSSCSSLCVLLVLLVLLVSHKYCKSLCFSSSNNVVCASAL